MLYESKITAQKEGGSMIDIIFVDIQSDGVLLKQQKVVLYTDHLAVVEKERLRERQALVCEIESQEEQIAALEEREEDLVRNCARANAEKDILQTERDKWKAKCTCIVPDDYDADYANKIFGDRYGYDWEYRGVTTLKATIAEKEELIKKWRLACEAGTDAHKRYCDEIAAFTEKNEEIKDDMARAILAMNDQVFLIAALTARIKELTEALEKK
jgi:hypothetical protein